uniref:NADH-ubiquinone oxidoreductase chain 3 n=1 Tax=Tylosurus melanotus TaxID=3053213 RepID=A0A160EDH3_9TELE|nr:NADH dehydrogenase subunit 3 [Tylosurus acus melanotus]
MKFLMTNVLLSTLVSPILANLSLSQPQINPEYEKLSPYECAFDPLGSGPVPFSFRLFLLVTVYLLFDLDNGLLLPLQCGYQLPLPLTPFCWASTNLLLRTHRLIFEWSQGGMEWAE